MEVINHSLSPQKRKRTFIASMNKSNPYRICSITDSVYDRILLNRELARELATEIKVESPRDPKAIYLPPVRIEENSRKSLKKTVKKRKPWSPSSVDSTPKDSKFESFQLTSKSLDFSFNVYEKPQSVLVTRRKYEPKSDNKAFTWKARAPDENKVRNRTTSALQERDNFKIPFKFRENRSPWVFQTSKLFQI